MGEKKYGADAGCCGVKVKVLFTTKNVLSRIFGLSFGISFPRYVEKVELEPMGMVSCSCWMAVNILDTSPGVVHHIISESMPADLSLSRFDGIVVDPTS